MLTSHFLKCLLLAFLSLSTIALASSSSKEGPGTQSFPVFVARTITPFHSTVDMANYTISSSLLVPERLIKWEFFYEMRALLAQGLVFKFGRLFRRQNHQVIKPIKRLKLWSANTSDLQIWTGQIVQNWVLYCGNCGHSWNSQFLTLKNYSTVNSWQTGIFLIKEHD